MIESFIKYSARPTLRQSQLVNIGIPSHQVRVWSNLIGVGGPAGKMPKSKWRTYTPAEVFMISVMRLLKSNLNFAFSGRETYIRKLTAPKGLLTALTAFQNGTDCFIISDYKTFFEIVDQIEAIQFAIYKPSLSIVIPTTPHIETMLQATAHSQNLEQRNLSLLLLKDYQLSPKTTRSNAAHHRALSNTGRPKR